MSRTRYFAEHYLLRPRRLAKNLGFWLRASVSDRPHVFVVGAPRSGTTLMQVVLGTHSRFATSETETAIFTFQDLFRADRSFTGIDLRRVHHARARSRDVVELFDNLVDETVPDRSLRFVEKTPQHFARARFILDHFPRAQILFMVRDGRDCYCSGRRHPDVPQALSPKTFAKYWRACARTCLRYERHPRVQRVTYEELASRPTKLLQQVMAFLGEASEPAQLDPTKYGRDRRSRDRHFRELRAAINPSRKQRWRRELPPHLILEFEGIAGCELLALGYPLVAGGGRHRIRR